jgi:16S rRNA (uracil1498-N3)-methyltransferase
MTDRAAKIRLFVEAPLGPGAAIVLLPDQAHYLFNVMRAGLGAPVAVFNGRDGEWVAEVTGTAKRGGELTCRAAGQPQRRPPDLWLFFAPIKKARTDFIVEKATELGCARIQPVLTRYTSAERLRLDRLQAHAVEAAEQCGETYVPDVVSPIKLASLIETWDPARQLMFCDETRCAGPAAAALGSRTPGPWAILVGPEGGFAPDEAQSIRSLPEALPVTLGPRVLRADTAAVAAIALWQSTLGDWR